MKELAPHQQRVVVERDELSAKIHKLSDFIAATAQSIFATLPRDEQFRLRIQLKLMILYRDILDERIAAF